MCMFKDSKIYSYGSAGISLCVFAYVCVCLCVFLYVLAPSPLSSWSHQQGMLDLASVTV